MSRKSFKEASSSYTSNIQEQRARDTSGRYSAFREANKFITEKKNNRLTNATNDEYYRREEQRYQQKVKRDTNKQNKALYDETKNNSSYGNENKLMSYSDKLNRGLTPFAISNEAVNAVDKLNIDRAKEDSIRQEALDEYIAWANNESGRDSALPFETESKYSGKINNEFRNAVGNKLLLNYADKLDDVNARNEVKKSVYANMSEGELQKVLDDMTTEFDNKEVRYVDSGVKKTRNGVTYSEPTAVYPARDENESLVRYYLNNKKNENRQGELEKIKSEYNNKYRNSTDFEKNAFKKNGNEKDYGTVSGIGNYVFGTGSDEGTEALIDYLKYAKRPTDYASELGSQDGELGYIYGTIQDGKSGNGASTGLKATLRGAGYSPDILNFIKSDEKHMLYYLYNTGKYLEMEEYWQNYLEPALTMRYENGVTRRAEEAGKYAPISSSVLSVYTKPYEAIEGAVGFAKSMLGAKADDVADKQKFTQINQAIRSGVTEDIQSPVGQFFYGVGMSMADVVWNMVVANYAGGAFTALTGGNEAVSGVKSVKDIVKDSEQMSLILMSSEAASNELYNQMNALVRSGEDTTENRVKAIVMAGVAGFAEYITERVSIESFLGNPKNFFAAAGKQFIAEGSEEIASSVINTLCDEIVNGGASEISLRIGELMAGGMSKDEASKTALIEWLKNAGMEGLAGGVSGLFFGGFGSVSEAFSERSFKKDVASKYAEKIYKYGSVAVENEFKQGLNYGEDNKVTRYAQKVLGQSETSGENITERQLSKLLYKEINDKSDYVDITTESEETSDVFSVADDGKPLVKLGDSYISADNITNANLSRDVRDVYNTALNIVDNNGDFDAEAANRYVAAYDGSNADVYNAVYSYFFAMGKDGASYNETVNSLDEDVLSVVDNVSDMAKLNAWAYGAEQFDSGYNTKIDDNDFEIDNNVSEKLNESAKVYPRAVAERFVSMANDIISDNVDINKYSDAFAVVYNAGREGLNIDAVMSTPAFSVLGDKAMSVYRLGESYKNVEVENKAIEKNTETDNGKNEAGKFTDNTDNVTDEVKTVLELFSEAFGIEIDLENELPDGAIGELSELSRKMKLTGKNTFSGLLHECGHLMARYAPEQFRAIRDGFRDYVREKYGLTHYKALFDDVIKRYGEGKTTAWYEEEIICDHLVALQKKKGFAEDMAKTLYDAGYSENKIRKFFKSVAEFLKKVSSFIKSMFDTEIITRSGIYAAQSEGYLAKLSDEFFYGMKHVAEYVGDAKGETRQMRAGDNSFTADKSMLDTAKEMEANGIDSETIRRKTGWYKSYDGKWGYEIDDSKMIWRDDAEFNIQEHNTSDGDTYYTVRLGDLINHDELFKAYPRLKYYRIIIQETNPGTNGSTFADDKQIVLSNELFKVNTKEYEGYLNGGRISEIASIESSPEYKEWSKYHDDTEFSEIEPVKWLELEEKARKKFFDSEIGKRYYSLKWGRPNMKTQAFGFTGRGLDVLTHELQHAVQSIEGFASGSSPEYWVIKTRENLGRRLQDLRYDLLNAISDNSEYLNALYSYDKAVGDISKNSRDFEHLMAIAYDNSAKIITDEKAAEVFFDYADAVENYKSYNDNGNALYWRTAGEIEARDTEARREISAVERKNIRPDIDKTNVVFADNAGESYSIVEPFYDNDGKYYNNAVLLDTDFLDNVSPRNWGKKLQIEVEKRSKNNPLIIPIEDENGNMQILQFAKKNERTSKNGKIHKVNSELYRSTDNISKLSVIHIEEIIEVSEQNNPYYTNKNEHGWLDKNGWLHRNANVINKKNGNIYNVTVDIAKSADGRTILYATNGKIKRVGSAKVNSLKIKGSQQNSNPTNSIHKNSDLSIENDKKYLSAVKSGDMATAQAMVEQAARDKGYAYKMYHGAKKGKNFTVFRGWQYFTENKSYAERYTGDSKDNLYSVFVKSEKPFDTRNAEARKIFEKIRQEYGLTDLSNIESGLPDWTDGYDISDYIEENDLPYDMILLDEGGDLVNGKPVSRGISYVVRDSSQVKSADTVTYDDNGDVIPLSKRFNENESDIRNMLPSEQAELDKLKAELEESERQRDSEKLEHEKYVRATDKLIAEQKKLIEALRSSNTKNGGHIVSFESVKDIIRQLNDKYGLKLSLSDDASALTKIYSHIANAGTTNSSEFMDEIKKFVNDRVIPASYKLDDAKRKQYKGFLNDVRAGVRLNDNQVQELCSLTGKSWGKARSQFFGKINFSRDNGTYLDESFSEWFNEYPELFQNYSDDITDADEVSAIIDAVEYLKAENVSALLESFGDDNVAVEYLTNEIFNEYWNVDDVETVTGAKSEARAQAENEYNKAFSEYKRQTNKEIKLLTAQRDRTAQDFDKYIERTERENLRGKIKNLYNYFDKVVRHPTDSVWAPNNLYSAMLEVCRVIDFTYNYDTQIGKRLQNLKYHYDTLATAEDTDYSTEWDSSVSGYIQELSEHFTKRASIMTMSNDELRTVYELLNQIKGTLIDARKQIDSEEKMQNAELGAEFLTEQDKLGKNIGKIRSKFTDILSSIRAMKYLSGYENGVMNRQFTALEQGTIKGDMWRMEAKRPFEELMSEDRGRTFREFTHDLVETKLQDEDGRFVKLTHSQIVQIVMTAERERRSGYAYEHLFNGGITVPEQKALKAGKRNEALKKATRIKSISRQDVYNLEQLLNDYDKKWIRAAENFFNKVSSKALNEVLFKLQHRHMETSNYYIPFVVDKNFVKSDVEALSFNATLENAGYFKEAVVGAPQPLIMAGVDDVINSHVNSVATQYGLAIPLRNLKKVYNIYGVKNYINTNWGNAGGGKMNIVEQVMTDLQKSRKNTDVTFLDTIYKGYVRSVLVGNISVTLKQVASYETAGVYLRERAMWYGRKRIPYVLTHFSKVYNEIDKHTPLHYNRRLGLSHQELGDMAAKYGLWEKKGALQYIKPEKWIQFTDCYTTALLWEATKKEIEYRIKAEKSNIEIGSDEYFKQVTELYNRVIMDTQPMYDVLHRTEIMKKNNPLVHSLLMFRTVPFQNFGVIADSLGEFIAAKKRYESNKSEENKKAYRKATRKLGRANYVTITSAAVLGAITVAVAFGLRRDKDLRDEYGDITFESVFKAFGNNTLNGILSSALPFNFISSYGVSDAPINSTLSDLWDALKGTYETIDEIGSGEITYNSLGSAIKGLLWRGSDFYNLANNIAKIGGFPLDNVAKLADSVVDWADAIKYGLNGYLEREPSKYYQAIFDYRMSGDATKADEWYQRARNDGYSTADIDTGIKKLLKNSDDIEALGDAYIGGDWDAYDNIKKDLLDKGFTENQIYGARNSYIKSLNDEEDNPDAESKDVKEYDYNKISEIILSGNEDDIIRMADWYAVNGTKSALTRAIKETYINADDKTKAEIEDVLTEWFDYDDKSFNNWNTLYQYSDLYDAIKSNDTKLIDDILDNFSDVEKDEKTIRNQVTKNLKEYYRTLTGSERVKLQKLLRDNLGYPADYNFNSWLDVD